MILEGKDLSSKDSTSKTVIARSMNVLLLLVMSVLIYFLAACRSPEMPGVQIPLGQMNKQLRFYVPPEANTFKVGDHLGLVLENYSGKVIDFPEDYGVKIYIEKDGQWLPVENDILYPSGEKQVLPKEQLQFGGIMVVVNPAVNGNQPVTVRVVVTGNISSENQPVGAYTDIILQP
jgi:hypothetical protein